MDITLGTLIAGLAMLIALVGAIVNLEKWRRERKLEKAQLTEKATRAEAERDSIAVKGAEGALLVMERMLKLTTESEEKLRCKVKELETTVDEQQFTIRGLRREIQELKDTNTDQAARLAAMERRLSNVERGES